MKLLFKGLLMGIGIAASMVEVQAGIQDGKTIPDAIIIRNDLNAPISVRGKTYKHAESTGPLPVNRQDRPDTGVLSFTAKDKTYQLRYPTYDPTKSRLERFDIITYNATNAQDVTGNVQPILPL